MEENVEQGVLNKEISEEVKALIFRNLYEDPKEIAKKPCKQGNRVLYCIKMI